MFHFKVAISQLGRSKRVELNRAVRAKHADQKWCLVYFVCTALKVQRGSQGNRSYKAALIQAMSVYSVCLIA